MSTTPTRLTEQQKNFEVARRINREARADPNSIYTGKYIGVWRGEAVAVAVAVADSLDEVDALLNQAGAPIDEAAILEASVDYDQTYMIWEMWDA